MTMMPIQKTPGVEVGGGEDINVYIIPFDRDLPTIFTGER